MTTLYVIPNPGETPDERDLIDRVNQYLAFLQADVGCAGMHSMEGEYHKILMHVVAWICNLSAFGSDLVTLCTGSEVDDIIARIEEKRDEGLCVGDEDPAYWTYMLELAHGFREVRTTLDDKEEERNREQHKTSEG